MLLVVQLQPPYLRTPSRASSIKQPRAYMTGKVERQASPVPSRGRFPRAVVPCCWVNASY